MNAWTADGSSVTTRQNYGKSPQEASSYDFVPMLPLLRSLLGEAQWGCRSRI